MVNESQIKVMPKRISYVTIHMGQLLKHIHKENELKPNSQ